MSSWPIRQEEMRVCSIIWLSERNRLTPYLDTDSDAATIDGRDDGDESDNGKETSYLISGNDDRERRNEAAAG
jgi:hypothetical protein